MAKTIFKEFFIMLLLCVAIVLILGVIFYDYIPTNKAIPNPMAPYSTPEEIEAEIDENLEEAEPQNVPYTITGPDLNNYKRTNSYVAGKANPFAADTSVDTPTNGVTNNTGNGGSTGNNNNTNTENNNNQNNTSKPSDDNSTGTFYNTGLK